MKLLPINAFDSFKKLNRELWSYCWKYWYQKEYMHQGIKEYLMEELRQIKEENKDIQILDIGCGSGWFAKYFDSFYTEYTGIDFNNELIEQLTKDYSNNYKCSFFLHDIESGKPFPFKKKKFNLVIASFILLELSNLESFFIKAASLQKSGDYMIITGLDPVNEILRISSSQVELEENLNIYRHAKYPIVLSKEMTLLGESTNFTYLRVLYSIKDIITSAFLHSYELIDLNDKFNQQSDSSKSPIYYTLKLRKR